MPEKRSIPPPIEIGLRLPNLMFLTRPCREFVSHTLESQGFAREQIDEIALVCTEVAQNSFEHASDKDWHTVEIDMRIDEEKWVFCIRDEGKGRLQQEDFDFSGKGPPSGFKDRGRGTFLIASFSDKVVVRTAPNGGTEVEITKYRKAADQ
jgi:anti-sigma regulatory factor (Ser/Thr protein kinase)